MKPHPHYMHRPAALREPGLVGRARLLSPAVPYRGLFGSMRSGT